MNFFYNWHHDNLGHNNIYYTKSKAVFTAQNPAWHTNNYQDKHPQ